MSFGSSVGDCILLAQLAWSTYQGAKRACGEHDELTREVSSLYKVLNRLRKDISNPESFVNKASIDKRQELEEHAAGCEGILKTMNNVLSKYNALTGEQRRGKKLWQKIKFGNGQTKDLAEIRIKLSAHTAAIMMSLNLCSLDSLGRVEATLGRVEARSTSHGEQLRGIRKALHWVTANMAATSGEGSVWTSYTNDDQMFWRELRRELAKEGYRSATLQRHKRLIKSYVEELGNRGVFDDIIDFEEPINQSENSPSGNRLDSGQSIPFEASPIISQQNDDDGRTLSKPASSITGPGEAITEPEIAVSGIPTPHLEPIGNGFEDHDGVDQHNHASAGSHVEGTNSQDENDSPEIALITTTTVEGMTTVSQKDDPSPDVDSAATSIIDKSFIENFRSSTLDEPDAVIEPLETLSLNEPAIVRIDQFSPSSEILEDLDDVENIEALDLPIDLDRRNRTTPVLEGSPKVLDHFPAPYCQSATPSTASPSTSPETTPMSEDEMELTPIVTIDGLDISCNEVASVPVEPSCQPRSPFAVQIEEVLDEEFVRYARSHAFEKTNIIFPGLKTSATPMHHENHPQSEDADTTIDAEASIDGASGARSAAWQPPSIEEVPDEDFSADAHPNVSTADSTFDYDPDTGATLASKNSAESSSRSSSRQKQSSKSVRFADTESDDGKSGQLRMVWASEDLRFIFFKETRDFNSYQELQESYQALFDETEGYNSVDFNKPENTTTFITHSPYTPPATMFDLQYYRVPASYYHTFWHPQRVPIYLHGNVFDGISLTNWIYNWTAYTFKDNSYQMTAVRRLGKIVTKLGAAMSDIEHAKPAVKTKLPKDLYDESGVLWADFENIINDIMSEAEDRLDASKQSGRLEVEFVSRFCHELIAGNKYYHSIENFLKKTEEWCKKARFHPDFIMLWELWES